MHAGRHRQASTPPLLPRAASKSQNHGKVQCGNRQASTRRGNDDAPPQLIKPQNTADQATNTEAQNTRPHHAGHTSAGCCQTQPWVKVECSPANLTTPKPQGGRDQPWSTAGRTTQLSAAGHPARTQCRANSPPVPQHTRCESHTLITPGGDKNDRPAVKPPAPAQMKRSARTSPDHGPPLPGAAAARLGVVELGLLCVRV